MRTTLTIDDDVAAAIERLQRTRKATLKDIVNEGLRLGLREMDAKPKRRPRIETRAFDVGEVFVKNLDNIAEVLAFAEGEDYK